MIPRKRLDIGWSDLLFGVRQSLTPGHSNVAATLLEQEWSPGSTVACLSVRSGFDALLSVLDLPPGSEVLVSAVTIRDMIRILEAHALVPVPVDVDFGTLSVDLESLEAALTPRTRAVLVAHLFGSRMPLDAIAEFARRQRLFLIEDCAQAFTGDSYRGHAEADASMFSFGPIKTATALGGGLLRFRDPDLARKVRSHMGNWPVQTRGEIMGRLLRFTMLKALSARWLYSAFVGSCRLVGIDHDALVGQSARGFPAGELLKAIRRQPSMPLLRLMRRRIIAYQESSTNSRRTLAQHAVERIPCETPGREAEDHSYWVFPILHDEPDRLVRHLVDHGFDATRGASSLYVVKPSDDLPRPCTPSAQAAFDKLLYLPVYPGVSLQDIARLAEALRSFRPVRTAPVAAPCPIQLPAVKASTQ